MFTSQETRAAPLLARTTGVVKALLLDQNKLLSGVGNCALRASSHFERAQAHLSCICVVASCMHRGRRRGDVKGVWSQEACMCSWGVLKRLQVAVVGRRTTRRPPGL